MLDLASLFRQFHSAVERRAAAEVALGPLAALDPAESRLRADLNQWIAERQQQLQELDAAADRERSDSAARWSSQLADAAGRHARAVQSIEDEAERAAAAVERQRGESEWVVSSVLDESAEGSPVREFERFKHNLQKAREEQVAELTDLDGSVQQVLIEHDWSERLPHQPESPPADRDDAQIRFAAAIAAVRAAQAQFENLLLPKFVRGFRGLFLGLILACLVGLPVYLLVDPALAGAAERSAPAWMAVSFGGGIGAGLLATVLLYSIAVSQQSSLLRQMLDSKAEAAWIHQHWLRFAREQLERRQQEFEKQRRLIERERREALKRFESGHARKVDEIASSRESRLAQERQRAAAEREELTAARDAELERIEQAHQQQRRAAETRWQSVIVQQETELARLVSQRQRERTQQLGALKADWERAWQSFDKALRDASAESAAAFPSWEALAAGNWRAAERVPESIRIGEMAVDLNRWERAVSSDMRLAPRVTNYRIPVRLPFPEKTSLLFRSPNAEARAQAISALQTVMLRLLTRVPPGKLRFTILDPLALGESFSGFMHLADYDELLVTSRIWTESSQIEARLADLTEHMENVLQKYLRNEFQTIEEYNASAGEVAEPYHILAINDFPAKFSEIAARRLTSVVNSGPRCGVYTLLNVDPGKPLPHNFQLADIEEKTTRFDWRDGAFHLNAPDLAAWPIFVDPPPPPEEFTRIVRMVGEGSRDARRVEVSFQRVRPESKEVWTHDSRAGLAVPLGRAGATRLQELRLGKGTSQHMLIAGKTGSGKSTFLHILITNLALHYSPDEIQFYLIDFKKGVEFKAYATHHLPHARVIAVESDREFGVSALQKLDDVLQERGELFRRHGVQDIAAYRNKTSQPLPRILLVVDEFQEFFIEDDKLSQTAALLLDRLVRQGRAFGMHVVLGSQTLGGAYTLARSTLGQVAVRVALQCSEADAHLILSEENTAARLLARPGEAIYNDANGLAEGNHPFQIAWLGDDERDQQLSQIQDRAFRRGLPPAAPIVFEGNIPSDVTRNVRLGELIDSYSTRERPLQQPTLWLGDAVEIAPPTEVTFSRQSGNHLLFVGADAEAAQGAMAAGLTALAASLAPKLPRPAITLFDGSLPEGPEAAAWQRLLRALPVEIPRVDPLQAAAALNALHEELIRREATAEPSPPLFLFVYHIARFRDLRKVEDDFGLGGFGGSEPKPAAPGKLFADLLARGPAVGMHAILWCDSANNLDRWLSRQSLKELERRVAFQMNAADSSNLIDSPAASRLGTHRALLYREETGTTEKFRPYGLPPEEWLENVNHRLRYGPDADFATDLAEFSII